MLEKKYHLPFLRNSDLRYPFIQLSAPKILFFTNYLFFAVITRTHTPTHTHSVFPTENALKTRLTPFSLNYFFLLSTPSPYPGKISQFSCDKKGKRSKWYCFFALWGEGLCEKKLYKKIVFPFREYFNIFGPKLAGKDDWEVFGG